MSESSIFPTFHYWSETVWKKPEEKVVNPRIPEVPYEEEQRLIQELRDHRSKIRAKKLYDSRNSIYATGPSNPLKLK